jgi:hypothetical protein|tara:strand:+ start:80 stop:280 length:201 start_codon:yes stop_codon:yes gene_type:complete
MTGTIINTPEKIDRFRLLALFHALKLETKGMKLSKGRSAYSIAKEQLNLKGNKLKVLAQLKELLKK